ncbi:MAG: hypothetical protein RI907_1658 [Pseudomonadota bacterium]|jgi:preprotein translocase subunit SecA
MAAALTASPLAVAPPSSRVVDPTLARRLAGPHWRRAPCQRDERQEADDSAVERWLGDLPGWLPPARVSRRRVESEAAAIQREADALRGHSDAELARCLLETLAEVSQLADPLAHAALWHRIWACVGLGSQRALGLWPHGVQFAGAALLLQGRLAEMRTGEGKTLVAAMAATVMAASGAQVHVVSTNDYLAARDSEEMAPLMALFGLSVGHVVEPMKAPERRAAYAHPVCYVSGKELVFDYLKDTLAGHGRTPWRVSLTQQWWGADTSTALVPEAPVIPALHFAIVDEADSVLIDEASTPMILSKEVPGQIPEAVVAWAVRTARSLNLGQDYVLVGGRQMELRPGALHGRPVHADHLPPMWQAPAWQEVLVRQALTALHLFHRDQHYLVSAEGKVQIVDESTGRLMPDRSWEQGLHQMIEAKEGLAQSAGRDTLARMTFQRFFRRYDLLAGLTGTAAEASRELWSVYRLAVHRVPPHQPDGRLTLPPHCVARAADKWPEVVADARRAAARGQAVLVGTRSVEASEQVAEALREAGVAHVVLNARQDADEAEVVAQAGQSGRITVATNMAGRGTDIRLDAQARAAGGLHVILTEFHESARVDRQLWGRGGRQGDPGSLRAIVSLDDALWRLQPGPWRWLALRGGWWGPWAIQGARAWAQATAERKQRAQRQQALAADRQIKRLIGFAGRAG